LISEQGDGGGAGYSVYLRKTDGSPAVRLGAGDALAMSADTKWVIAQRLDPAPAQLMLLPTGAGESRLLTNDDITHLTAAFTPDGKQFVFTGFQPGKKPRTWMQSLSGGAPRPITPEGVANVFMTPDGTKIMARNAENQRMFYPVDGAAPTPVPSVRPDEGIIRFTPDGRSLVIRPISNDRTASILSLNLTTGVRTPLRTVTPLAESVGMGGVGQLLVTPDASAYVYGYGVTQSDLYLVKGLQ
jgi:dipeptidyl aminopeptidase/acylaminoacyl peptidase